MNRRRAVTRDATTGDIHRATPRRTRGEEKKREKNSVVDMSKCAWIVGVDASPASIRAVRWFAETIGRAGDRARLVHVIPGCDAMRSAIGDARAM
jgi:hypothetical protein